MTAYQLLALLMVAVIIATVYLMATSHLSDEDIRQMLDDPECTHL